jgi:hypothetical protein
MTLHSAGFLHSWGTSRSPDTPTFCSSNSPHGKSRKQNGSKTRRASLLTQHDSLDSWHAHSRHWPRAHPGMVPRQGGRFSRFDPIFTRSSVRLRRTSIPAAWTCLKCGNCQYVLPAGQQISRSCLPGRTSRPAATCSTQIAANVDETSLRRKLPAVQRVVCYELRFGFAERPFLQNGPA